MKTTLEIAFETVQELVQNFVTNKHFYIGPDYPEAQARMDFINKFFIALGWDVNHDIQKNPYEQEVKVEPPVIVGATQRHADYAFRLAPNFNDVRFFVEAKKPSAVIATPENYFQVVRYGWNSQTPLAVLTDFHHFHVIDCRFKPDPDTALNHSVATYHYTEYTDREKFSLIYWLFSREAVLAGSLQKRAAGLPKPRGKTVQRGLFPGAYKPVDESFLEQLDEFRTDLARAFKTTDPDLDSETLTELTQRTLDRLVFLRFLEDKGIEIQHSIGKFGNTGTVWEDFVAACRRLDGIYNGIIFKQHSILDAPTFRVDEAIFEGICEHLAAVNTPYDFNSIPIHILGSIYERFLGNVIIATAKRVRIEDKPETRKAGGVYYTPEHISRYIAANTVGKIIADRSPTEIATMRFADIACGSGSFLLSIYDLLLQYHGSYYNTLSKREMARTVKNGDCIERDGRLYLSLRKKREILLNNVYGVDIDSQAVEVTQLSLFLRLLQEETTVSARQYLLDFEHVRQLKKLLPDLSKNIVCGNSLIGTDNLDDQIFSSDEERKLNAMNFDDAFPEIMKHGGFDAIIGNPPYVRPHKLTSTMKRLLWARYPTFVAKSDLYSCFIERGLGLTRSGGLFSYIVPQTWTSLESFTAIRRFIIESAQVLKLVQLPKRVFAEATVETCIFVFERRPAGKILSDNSIKVEYLNVDGKPRFVREFPQKHIEEAYLYNFQLYTKNENRGTLDKVISKGKPLSQFIKFLYGFKTADDAKFIHKNMKFKENKLFIRSAAIQRYAHTPPEEYVWYVPDLMIKNAKTARPGEAARFESEKIMVARMGKSLVATYDQGGLYVKDAMLLLPRDHRHNLKYLLGLINSRLLNYFYREFFVTIDVLKNALLSLPIRTIDFDDSADQARHDKIVRFVETILEAKRQLAAAKTDKYKTYYENKCASLDRQIDLIVYDIYGLTEEEIDLVEAAGDNSESRVPPRRPLNPNVLPFNL